MFKTFLNFMSVTSPVGLLTKFLPYLIIAGVLAGGYFYIDGKLEQLKIAEKNLIVQTQLIEELQKSIVQLKLSNEASIAVITSLREDMDLLDSRVKQSNLNVKKRIKEIQVMPITEAERVDLVSELYIDDLNSTYLEISGVKK